MNGKAHCIGGVVAGVAATYLGFKYDIDIQPLYVMSGALLGGLLPDIDHPKSSLGKWFPLSGIIYSTVGHRTLTHSFIFMILMGFLFSILNASLGAGVVAGILSHMFLDMLFCKGKGVALFYPVIKDKFKIGF